MRAHFHASCEGKMIITFLFSTSVEGKFHENYFFHVGQFLYFPDPVPSSINPFIRHWEPAHFSRDALDQAHAVHEVSRRRKRDINYNHNSPNYGPANVVKFNFHAHDR